MSSCRVEDGEMCEKRAAKWRVGSLANGRNFQNYELRYLELGKPIRYYCVLSLVRRRDFTCYDLCISGSAWVRGHSEYFSLSASHLTP